MFFLGTHSRHNILYHTLHVAYVVEANIAENSANVYPDIQTIQDVFVISINLFPKMRDKSSCKSALYLQNLCGEIEFQKSDSSWSFRLAWV